MGTNSTIRGSSGMGVTSVVFSLCPACIEVRHIDHNEAVFCRSFVELCEVSDLYGRSEVGRLTPIGSEPCYRLALAVI